jgi:hypothetical protein
VTSRRRRFGVWSLALGIGFVLLATLNSAGYRYGASDQAFYIPAVLRHLDPSLFPRDRALIDAQGRLIFIDDIAAFVVRYTHVSIPSLFAILYVTTLGLLFAAALRIGAHVYRTRGAVLALAAALTLRHAIAKTGANTLEGYFHPRQLAFAIALFSLAGFLERRERATIALLVTAAVIHPTTAVWFAIWIGVATWLERPERRQVLAAGAALAGVAAVVALWRGPLAGHLARMDPAWLAVIGDRDYLFPLAWPADVWFTNLIAIPIIVSGWRARARAHLAIAGETPLVVGALALAAIFFAWLPFSAAHVAIAVQLQVTRVFWLIDFLGTVYLVWFIAEGRATGDALRKRAWVAAAVIVVLSSARGVYSCFFQFPDRQVVAIDIQRPDWRDAMAWARTTAPGSGWLADPHHAALYGSTVRAAGHRDVVIDLLKDPAIAMYDRGVAMELADRERALAQYAWDTPDGARALAQRYALDFLVIDRPLPLPLAHQAGSLFIYRIR